ncbi:transglycosylase domain-containing protein [Actinomycetota bacterium]
MRGRTAVAPRLGTLLGAFVATAMVMGLVAAGLMIPAVGASGTMAKSGVALFDSLPSEFTANPLAQQSRILDAKGNVLATPAEENRVVVPLSKIDPMMQKAQIAIEDSRFFEHGGMDLRGLSRALISNIRGGDVQGASTLTQQYVKISLQENALAEGDQEAAKAAVAKNYTRKLQELKYAVALEEEVSKEQILEGYLNLVYYGDKAYGVEAASRHYFGHSANKMSIAEAALLAGTVRSPGSTDPVNNPKRAFERRNVVINRMHQLGVISTAEAEKAKSIPIKSMLNVTYPKTTCAASGQPYYCEYILAWLKQQPSLGKTLPERIKKINRGGLTIKTTLDPELQAYTVARVQKKVPSDNAAFVGAAATVIEPSTGKVLAMAQSSKFGDAKMKYSDNGKALLDWNGSTQVNWNVDQKYGGTNGFAFGSTAKMYALATAMEQGRSSNSSVNAPFADTQKAHTFFPSQVKDECGFTGPWPVRNDEPIGGDLPLSTATAKSVNTAFAQLVLDLGGCNVAKVMAKMGMHQGNGKPITPVASALTLGSDDTTPLTIASSYATLANGGKYCAPRPVESITDPAGKPVKFAIDACKQVIRPSSAASVTRLLRGVITNGTGRGADIGRPAAGKTGTTDNHVESWFVGYTPQRATAVWVGTPLTQKRMRGICLDQCYGEVFGGTVAAPLWRSIMLQAHKGLKWENFKTAEADPASDGGGVPVPATYGMSYEDAVAAIEEAGFTAYRAGVMNSARPKGQVAGTSPFGTAPKGSSIGIYLSTGVSPDTATPDQPTVSATTAGN